MNLTFWLFFFWFSFVMLCLLFVVTFALVIAWLRTFGQMFGTILLLHLSIMAQRMFGFMVYEHQLCSLFLCSLLAFVHFAVVILSVTCSVIHIQFLGSTKKARTARQMCYTSTKNQKKKQIQPPSSFGRFNVGNRTNKENPQKPKYSAACVIFDPLFSFARRKWWFAVCGCDGDKNVVESNVEINR